MLQTITIRSEPHDKITAKPVTKIVATFRKGKTTRWVLFANLWFIICGRQLLNTRWQRRRHCCRGFLLHRILKTITKTGHAHAHTPNRPINRTIILDVNRSAHTGHTERVAVVVYDTLLLHWAKLQSLLNDQHYTRNNLSPVPLSHSVTQSL